MTDILGGDRFVSAESIFRFTGSSNTVSIYMLDEGENNDLRLKSHPHRRRKLYS